MRRGEESKETSKAIVSPSIIDIAWAAGFMEGEGNFGQIHDSQKIMVAQKNHDPLQKLKDLFGGKITIDYSWGGNGYIFRWKVYGSRARGIMMTVFKFMSDKKKSEIRFALYGSNLSQILLGKQ